jgi:simple sugar transport system substrate-binding protein
MTNRPSPKFLALAAILAAAGLTACGQKPAPAPAPVAAPAAPAKPAPLKAAFVYVGPVGDAGYTFAHDAGRKEAAAKLGDKVATTFVESVKEGPDAERVIRDLATQGNKVIFATSFGFGDSMAKVAKDFPDVYFEHATGFKTSENMRVYEPRIHEVAYLAGIVAGRMTKTNTLGFVGSFAIPEVLRNINAFTLGAQSVNPKVKTKVIWVSTWFDPPKETEAAKTLINGKADVLLQNTDSTAVLQEAERQGKYAFGWDSDMSAFAPKAHLGSCMLLWGVYYEKALNDVLAKTWKTGETKWGHREGMTDFIKIPDTVPADVKKKVEEAKAGLKAGTLDIFKGPIVDNTGKERLKKGVAADDKWLGGVDFLVKGVEGKVPASK